MQSRRQIRAIVREKRNALNSNQAIEFSALLEKRLTSLETVTQAKHIAIYLANDGELDPIPFINWCLKQNKKVYLPVIHPFSKGNLLFLHFDNTTPMTKNRYGISEPKLDVTKVCPVEQLDIIFTPLVAFDKNGERLGMGGGFYDRTLATCQDNKGISIIGLAHDCQEVENLPVECWDIPLPAIVTPTRSLLFK
ncbi:MAG: 5-formyltetrahydrofolate cyclo-ligase [Colwellia sp.]